MSASKIVEFKKETREGSLVIGKQKKTLEHSLDFAERRKLKEAIAAECKRYMQQVTEKIGEDYDSSIMMDPDDTKIKNEILKKIKFQKMKKTKLSNFIRLKREEILNQRDIDQRLLLMNQSEASLASRAVSPKAAAA